MKLIQPKFKESIFTCPHCLANSHMEWSASSTQAFSVLLAATCVCGESSFWLGRGDPNMFGQYSDGRMIFPMSVTAPHAHQDMPESCKADFNEAREVFSVSPRSSAALLRLCLEKLCNQLVGTEDRINDQIKKLVAAGLPMGVQQALDSTRIVGNNALHILELDVANTPSLVMPLFGLINFIVENQISQPKQIAAFYQQMPEKAVESVVRRDQPKR